LNNIIIYSNILKEHINYIFKILEYLDRRNLYFKLKKYKFYKKEISFLKFVVKQYKICINFEKLQTIKKLQLFINVKKV